MKRGIGSCFAVLLLCTVVSCKESSDAQPESRVMPVDVAAPINKEIVEYDEYIGRFRAVKDVEIRARVSGYLDKILFDDGQLVKAGDVLFIIDQRPYKEELKLAEGELAQAKAERIFNDKQLTRFKTLRQREVASEVDLDQATFKAEDSHAKELIAQARVDKAKLNLEYTEVKAPIDGRVSRNFVDVGNLVQGGENEQTLLTRIVSVDPIDFYFEVDENNFLKYSRLFKSGEGPTAKASTTPIKVKLMDEKDFMHDGMINFVDNTFDPDSGTLEVRAVIKNPEMLIQPGQFGRLQLPASKHYKAILLPDRYIINEQDQYFAFVVDKDNKVQKRLLKIGPMVDDLRIIHDGLSSDDHVLISNILLMRPGQVVKANVVDLNNRKQN